MSEGDQRPAGGTTQELETLKRRIYQEVGEWFAKHWRELASAAGGVMGGGLAVYALFAAQVHGAAKAADDAMKASSALTANVAALTATVNQLVTQQQLHAAETRIQQLEDWKCYAQQYRTKQSPGDCRPGGEVKR